LHNRETDFGLMQLIETPGACVRAAALEVMSNEPAHSAARVYALDLVLETTRYDERHRRLSMAEACAIDEQWPLLPKAGSFIPLLLAGMSAARPKGFDAARCKSLSKPSVAALCRSKRTR
jgi:hypothetical protein